MLTLPPEPLASGEMTPHDVADALERAAQLIEIVGLYSGDYWPNSPVLRWAEGVPVDVTGAIGVACGYRSGPDLDRSVVGVCLYDASTREQVDVDPHPVLCALMRHLGATKPEQVFLWSDEAGLQAAVERLRTCAAELRLTAGAPS